MFYIDKCKNCERYGYVAEKQGDVICKLCKDERNSQQTKENKDNDNDNQGENQ